ncbi:hypothetical protein Tco_0903133 [Tanacetum coccineum]
MGTKVTSSSGLVLEEPEIRNARCSKIFKENSLKPNGASHEQELKMMLKKLSERQLQIQECKVQKVQSSVTSSGDEISSGIVSDEKIDKQELEAHYGFMATIQEVFNPLQNRFYVTPWNKKHAAECADERAALANLIANLTLDIEENKTILRRLKKANASLTQELEEFKTNLDETSRALGEAISCRDSCLIALQNKQNEFEKYKAFNDRGRLIMRNSSNKVK